MTVFKRITLLQVFKTVAFIITLVLLIFYESLPKRTMALHPELTKNVYESVDDTIGGNSEIIWVDKSQLSWICHLRAGTPYPYCGIYVMWSKPAAKQLDLSLYDGLEVELDYNGPATYLRVYLRNYYPAPDISDIVGKAKFNSFSTLATDFKRPTMIPFKDLRVADWWIDNNKIPPKEIKTDISKVIAIGIDIPYPNTLGRHEFKLKSIKATGYYFSKETLYFSIIIFWAAFIISEILIRQTRLLSMIKASDQQLKEFRTISELYREKAEHDQLTDILNREGLNRIVDDLYAKKSLNNYALLVLDLDFFKTINDDYGHVVGDNVLQEVSNIFKVCIRSYDIVARWGGEEFIILFHSISSANIEPFAEKIRKTIESTSFVTGKVQNITVSIGATKIARSELFENAFIRADKALYQAKETGRNKTIIEL
ncbi:GGDEF domain-containing protein [Paraglaciecola sp.]|uniref:GGDEF domain-containing protein n=1 Tax=Paraglaciecola sp. TaxID=1920173 RepID=UPI0032631D64